MRKLNMLKKGTLLFAVAVVILFSGIVVKASSNKPPVVKGVRANNITKDSATLTWSSCSGVSGYIIYSVGDGEVARITSTSYRVSNLSPGSLHKYKIKSYIKEDGQTIVSDDSNVVKVLTKPCDVFSVQLNNVKNSGFRVVWNSVCGANGYEIYVSENSSANKLVNKSSSCNYNATNLKGNTKYYVKIRTYVKKEGEVSYGNYSKVYNVTTLPSPKPPVVKGVRANNITKDSVTLTWSSCSGVSGYIVCSESGSELYKTTSTSYRVSGLKSGKVYRYKIKSYIKEDGNIIKSDASNPVKVLTKPNDVNSIQFNSIKNDRLHIEWNSADGANGYEIYMSESSFASKLLRDSYSTSSYYNVNSLKGNTKYYVKIRPYAKKEGEVSYGNYSKVYNVTTLPSPITNLTQIEPFDSNSITMKWNYRDKVDEFRIYYYDKESEKWICHGKVDKNTLSYTIKDLEPGVKLKVKVRAIAYNNKKEIFDPGCSEVTMSTVQNKDE